MREQRYYYTEPCPNLGKGTAATSPLLEFDSPPAPDTPGYWPNYKSYDQWLNWVLPVLVPVWSKDSKEAWSDARLICMRPEEVKQEISANSSARSNPTTTMQPTPIKYTQLPLASLSSKQSSATPSQPTSGVREDPSSRATTVGSIFITTLLLLTGWM